MTQWIRAYRHPVADIRGVFLLAVVSVRTTRWDEWCSMFMTLAVPGQGSALHVLPKACRGRDRGVLSIRGTARGGCHKSLQHGELKSLLHESFHADV